MKGQLIGMTQIKDQHFTGYVCERSNDGIRGLQYEGMDNYPGFKYLSVLPDYYVNTIVLIKS